MSMKTTVDQLADKISREYELMCENWREATADELVDNAEHIATAKFVRENIGSCVSEEEAEYLLKFKEPLAVLIDAILYQYDPMNIARQEWFSDYLYDLCDKKDLDSDHETEEEISMQ